MRGSTPLRSTRHFLLLLSRLPANAPANAPNVSNLCYDTRTLSEAGVHVGRRIKRDVQRGYEALIAWLRTHGFTERDIADMQRQAKQIRELPETQGRDEPPQ